MYVSSIGLYNTRKKTEQHREFSFAFSLLCILTHAISYHLSHNLFSITITLSLRLVIIHNGLTLAGASGLRGKIDRPILGQLEARRSRVPTAGFWLFRSVLHRPLVSTLFTQLFSNYWQTYYYIKIKDYKKIMS